MCLKPASRYEHFSAANFRQRAPGLLVQLPLALCLDGIGRGCSLRQAAKEKCPRVRVSAGVPLRAAPAPSLAGFLLVDLTGGLGFLRLQLLQRRPCVWPSPSPPLSLATASSLSTCGFSSSSDADSQKANLSFYHQCSGPCTGRLAGLLREHCFFRLLMVLWASRIPPTLHHGNVSSCAPVWPTDALTANVAREMDAGTESCLGEVVATRAASMGRPLKNLTQKSMKPTICDRDLLHAASISRAAPQLPDFARCEVHPAQARSFHASQQTDILDMSEALKRYRPTVIQARETSSAAVKNARFHH